MNALFLAPNLVDVYARIMGEHLRGLLTMSARRHGFLTLQDQERVPFTVPVPRPWVRALVNPPRSAW